jgi:phosphatidate cytidylyltransferase
MNSIAASGDMATPVSKSSSVSALRSRILSAVVLAPLALGGIYAGFPYFDILVAAASAIMAAEWRRLCGGKIVDLVGGLMITGILVGIGAVSLMSGTVPALIILIVALGISVLSAILGEGRQVSIACSLGVLFVGAFGISLSWIRLLDPAGLEIVVWLVAAIWLTDICAYFAGRAIGGPKLAPRISPKKTWAGLLGGVAAAAIWTILWGRWMDVESMTTLAMVGAGTAVLAQLGDLGVSVLKRKFGAKDTGNLIPGHGGVMDRMDGFMGSTPPVALAIVINGSGGSSWL